MQSSLFFSHYPYYSPRCEQSENTIYIRSATFNDINQIADVLTRSFHTFNDLMWWFYPLITLSVSEDLRNRLRADNPFYRCIVATIPANLSTGTKEKIIGTVELSVYKRYYWLGKKEYCYLANFAVKKDYRRKGIGSQLLKHCEQIVINWGFDQVNLHVLANNHQAQELYLQNGYQIQQIETDLYSLFVTSQRRLLLTKSI